MSIKQYYNKFVKILTGLNIMFSGRGKIFVYERLRQLLKLKLVVFC